MPPLVPPAAFRPPQPPPWQGGGVVCDADSFREVNKNPFARKIEQRDRFVWIVLFLQ